MVREQLTSGCDAGSSRISVERSGMEIELRMKDVKCGSEGV